MAWYDRFLPKPKRRSGFRRSYAGAQGGRLFADWTTSNASADQEISGALQTLRDRSRALARNDGYISRYLKMLVNNVIGHNGIRLSCKARNDDGTLDVQGNQTIERAWNDWSRFGMCTANGRQSFIDCQQLFVESLARDGESLIRHLRSDNPYGYQIQFLESDHLDEQYNTKNRDSGNSVIMGVEVNQFGKPVAYYILKNHPGNTTQYNFNSKYIRLPAEDIIHGYYPTRAEQTRGVPWTSSVLARMKMLSGFEESAVVNARVGASKMGFLVSPDGEDYIGEDTENTYTPVMDASPGSIEQLPAGTEFKSWNPDYPNTTFEPFQKAILRGIASGLNVSYVSLSNNLEGVNYSSIRQGVMEDRDNFKILQRFTTDHFIDPVFRRWLEAAMTTGAIDIPITKYEKFANSANFIPRSWTYVNPLQEMQAQILGMQNGQTTMQDVQSNFGRDVEELMETINREKALAEQYGIETAFEPFGVQKQPVPPEIINEENNQ